MADDRPRVGSDGRGAEEERLRGRLRIVAGIVILGLLVLLAVVDVVGRFVNPAFHIDPVMFGSLLGALLLLVGVEGAARLPWSGPK